MAVQDDARESQLIELFKLKRPRGAGRGDTDAQLVTPQGIVSFELKSTTDRRGSVTTARDVGPGHIAKWRGKHWLIGFYERDGRTLRFACYGSPQAIEPWIRRLEEYIRPDFVLASSAPELITLRTVHELIGKRGVYTLKDARRIQKQQLSSGQYSELMDLEGGYSPERMLRIVKDRCRYLIERGATLNNPHIPGGYFDGWERITRDHARRLRGLVAGALEGQAAGPRSARKRDRAR